MSIDTNKIQEKIDKVEEIKQKEPKPENQLARTIAGVALFTALAAVIYGPIMYFF